jgi:hypothetical protein
MARIILGEAFGMGIGFGFESAFINLPSKRAITFLTGLNNV